MEKEPLKGHNSNSLLRRGLENLTTQVLDQFQISPMAFLLIRIVEHLQIIYFLMRPITEIHWNFSFLSFFSIAVNTISVDELIKNHPEFFQLILYLCFAVFVAIAILLLLVSTKKVETNEAKISQLVKGCASILAGAIMALKTILIIPIANIIIVSITPSIAKQLNVSLSLQASIYAYFLTVLFVLVLIYTIYFFRENNPFSQLPYAGESIQKSILWTSFKIALVCYGLLDLDGAYHFEATISMTVALSLMIALYHFSVGPYLLANKKLELHLLYICLTFGLLHSADISSGEVTTMTYLVPLNVITFYLCEGVIKWRLDRIIRATHFQISEHFNLLEEQVMYLIHLVEHISLRQSRMTIEGYLSWSRRQNKRVGIENDHCLSISIADIDSEQGDYEQVKKEIYSFLIVMLEEKKKKYPQINRLDLYIGLINHYKLNNATQAYYGILKMSHHHQASFLDKIYQSYYLRIIEKEMILVENLEEEKAAKINRYYSYTNNMIEFEDTLEQCTKNHLQFWKLMLDKHPDIRMLEETGAKVTNSKMKAKKTYEFMNELNQHSIQLNIVYGHFLMNVTNEDSRHITQLKKAQQLLKNARNVNKGNDLNSKYDLNAKTAYVAISGDESKTGSIVHTNNFVMEYLGYHRQQLLQRNVKVIMPKIFADQHDSTLKNFLKSSKQKSKGQQLVVTGLHKDGYIVPLTLLIKILPTLNDGIRIVTFMGKLFPNVTAEDTVKSDNYILYRTDTQQVMGVTQNLISQYGIEPCLIYGHPLNTTQQLTVQRLFGVSIQADYSERIQTQQIPFTINTKGLQKDFYINKGNYKTELIDLEKVEKQNTFNGVERKVFLKEIWRLIYHGVPLKLIGVYERVPLETGKQHSDGKSSSCISSMIRQETCIQIKNEPQSLIDDSYKNDNEQTMALKNFKYFISSTQEPKAINFMNYICLLFIIIYMTTIGVLIANYIEVVQLNANIIDLYQMNLKAEMTTSEVLSLQNTNLVKAFFRSPILPAYQTTESQMKKIITFGKEAQSNVLPNKYYFDPTYNTEYIEYNLYNLGRVTVESNKTIESIIDNYFSSIEMMISTSALLISAQASYFFYQRSLAYLKEQTLRVNRNYVIAPALNQTYTISEQWYEAKINERKMVLIIVSLAMMVAVILWMAVLLPSTLGVGQINNRVLSLFTLIPNHEIYQLAHDCIKYMNQNLFQARAVEEFDFYEGGPINMSNSQRDIVDESPMSPIGSASQINRLVSVDFSQGFMRKKVAQNESVAEIQERFDKMLNSESSNKKITIIKFMVVAGSILAFCLFYLIFTLDLIKITHSDILNYKTISKRPALLRSARSFYTEYLLSPMKQPQGLPGIKSLTQNIITEFYSEEVKMLSIDLGGYAQLYNDYNNGDLCAQIDKYMAYSIFNQEFTVSQCVSVRSKILEKGIKTSIVNFLEDIRAMVSQYGITRSPWDGIMRRYWDTSLIAKYVQTPMLQIQSLVESSLTSNMEMSKWIIILSGSLILVAFVVCYKLVWLPYLQELNIKIWKTKGLLNLIPMRIVKNNEMLKNEFISGKFEMAIR